MTGPDEADIWIAASRAGRIPTCTEPPEVAQWSADGSVTLVGTDEVIVCGNSRLTGEAFSWRSWCAGERRAQLFWANFTKRERRPSLARRRSAGGSDRMAPSTAFAKAGPRPVVPSMRRSATRPRPAGAGQNPVLEREHHSQHATHAISMGTWIPPPRLGTPPASTPRFRSRRMSSPIRLNTS